MKCLYTLYRMVLFPVDIDADVEVFAIALLLMLSSEVIVSAAWK